MQRFQDGLGLGHTTNIVSGSSGFLEMYFKLWFKRVVCALKDRDLRKLHLLLREKEVAVSDRIQNCCATPSRFHAHSDLRDTTRVKSALLVQGAAARVPMDSMSGCTTESPEHSPAREHLLLPSGGIPPDVRRRDRLLQMPGVLPREDIPFSPSPYAT